MIFGENHKKQVHLYLVERKRCRPILGNRDSIDNGIAIMELVQCTKGDRILVYSAERSRIKGICLINFYRIVRSKFYLQSTDN